MAILIFLALVIFVARRATTPEERIRYLRAAVDFVLQVRDAADAYGRRECQPFREALRARTRWPLVSAALAALNLSVYLQMLFGPGAFDDPVTLIAWGGNVGLRTTNGEWWRLVTSMFVHAGTVHLLVNVATLVQLGLMLERLLGHLTFTVVYFAAGLFASLVSLTGSPLNVTVGASGAIFGLYGALIASAIWGRLERSSVTIPLHALARLGPAAAVFILYNTTTGSLGGSAESTGFVVGLATGIVLAEGVGDRKPAIGRLGVVTGIAAVLAIAARVPLGAVVDARPEIARVVALEQQLAGAYQPAVERFKNGHMKAEALADLIDQHIVPELKAAQGRLSALGPVPKEHQPLVASAQEYLRLRDESWRLRAEGLHKRNMLTLRQADRTERASLDALERIRKPYPTPR